MPANQVQLPRVIRLIVRSTVDDFVASNQWIIYYRIRNFITSNPNSEIALRFNYEPPSFRETAELLAQVDENEIKQQSSTTPPRFFIFMERILNQIYNLVANPNRCGINANNSTEEVIQATSPKLRNCVDAVINFRKIYNGTLSLDLFDQIWSKFCDHIGNRHDDFNLDHKSSNDRIYWGILTRVPCQYEI